MRALVGSGYVGVSLFFVLSGFVLTYTYHDSLRDGTATRGAFVAARVARIYPVYLLSLLVALPPLFWLVASKGVRMQYGWLAGITGMYAGLLQAWDPRRACVLNCPAWSLSDEAFFYLAFLLVLPVVARWGLRRLATAAVAAYALALLAPVLYLVLRPDGAVAATPDARVSQAYWLAVVKYNPLIRLPEFVMGVIAGRLFLLEGGGTRRWHAWLEAGAVADARRRAAGQSGHPVSAAAQRAAGARVRRAGVRAGPRRRPREPGARHAGAGAAGGSELRAVHPARAATGVDVPRLPGAGVAPPPQPWHFVILATRSIAVSLLVFEGVEEPGRRLLRRASSGGVRTGRLPPRRLNPRSRWLPEPLGCCSLRGSTSHLQSVAFLRERTRMT